MYSFRFRPSLLRRAVQLINCVCWLVIKIIETGKCVQSCEYSGVLFNIRIPSRPWNCLSPMGSDRRWTIRFCFTANGYHSKTIKLSAVALFLKYPWPRPFVAPLKQGLYLISGRRPTMKVFVHFTQNDLTGCPRRTLGLIRSYLRSRTLWLGQSLQLGFRLHLIELPNDTLHGRKGFPINCEFVSFPRILCKYYWIGPCYRILHHFFMNAFAAR